MPPPRAIIFDLDGTLVDSLQDITNALNFALHRHGRPSAELEQVRAWVGDGIRELCRRALPDADPETLLNFSKVAQKHYLEHLTDRTGTYPNILPMLKLVKSRGVCTGVLSNKPHALTVNLVERLALTDYFDQVLGCMTEQDKKPSPRMAHVLAQRWSLDPAEILFVGDSPVDVLTAHNAGMIAVAATWGFRSRAELAAALPDHWVEDPLQILKLLDR